MTITFCDRCKKDISTMKPISMKYPEITASIILDPPKNSKSNLHTLVDLCPMCAATLNTFSGAFMENADITFYLFKDNTPPKEKKSNATNKKAKSD